MSMYNLIYGVNPYSDIILSMLEIDIKKVERFRDTGIDYKNNQIWIYTRTGGDNRKLYKNKILTRNKYYLNNKDDSYDRTYAEYNFCIPEEFKDIIHKFSKYNRDRVDWESKFKHMEEKMNEK